MFYIYAVIICPSKNRCLFFRAAFNISTPLLSTFLLSSCKVMVKIVNYKAYYSQTYLLAFIIMPFVPKPYKYALSNSNSLRHHDSSGTA